MFDNLPMKRCYVHRSQQHNRIFRFVSEQLHTHITHAYIESFLQGMITIEQLEFSIRYIHLDKNLLTGQACKQHQFCDNGRFMILVYVQTILNNNILLLVCLYCDKNCNLEHNICKKKKRKLLCKPVCMDNPAKRVSTSEEKINFNASIISNKNIQDMTLFYTTILFYFTPKCFKNKLFHLFAIYLILILLFTYAVGYSLL